MGRSESRLAAVDTATWFTYSQIVSATVVVTNRYERDVKRLLSADERAAMEGSIASAPEAHPVVAGTGGVRKARWGRQGKGKRGGVRAIYYFWSADDEVYLITVYAKSEKTDLTAEDRKAARLFVEAIKHEKEARR